MTWELPLHRLNSGHMQAWLVLPWVRGEMVSFLAKTYRSGCFVTAPTLRVIAVVSPRGHLTELPPPHRRCEFHELANKPSIRAGECACRGFWDPESQGPWGARPEASRDIHHPHCQCRAVSVMSWQRAYDSATARVAEKRSPQARPDEWSRQALALEKGETK